MQYNIYVTNKTKGFERIHARLRGDKLQESENYARIMNEMSTNVSLENEQSVSIAKKKGISSSDKKKAEFGYSSKHEDEKKSRGVLACLVQAGFSLINYGKPTPFAVEDINKLTYLSVHDEKQVWVKDYPVSPKKYGCITITGNKIDGITAHPSNPEPVWIERKRGDPLPDKAIYAGKTNSDGPLYFGRVTSYNGMPAKVNVSNDGKFCHNWWYCYDGEGWERKGDILKDTGYELVRARRGDRMPPNAIMTGVTDKDGPLFVGRAGGNVPCKVNVEDGKIWNFWYGNHGQNSTDCGEIMLLINDHSY